MKDHPSILEYRWQNRSLLVAGVEVEEVAGVVVVAVELVVRLLE
jgi:hypothetical protein